MNRIIGGKRYDTETAPAVAENGSRGISRGDFQWFRETLHKKRTGEFFLHGQGGAMTRYAQRVGQNAWQGGEDIIPLTIEHARTWAEPLMSGDEFEKIFGAVEE